MLVNNFIKIRCLIVRHSLKKLKLQQQNSYESTWVTIIKLLYAQKTKIFFGGGGGGKKVFLGVNNII